MSLSKFVISYASPRPVPSWTCSRAGDWEATGQFCRYLQTLRETLIERPKQQDAYNMATIRCPLELSTVLLALAPFSLAIE